ncbi:MAG: hypothetical protein M3534_08895, partial [Actinomycetota bacterium]|nr:hypothetical protein [Actinomycetota bacterium]
EAAPVSTGEPSRNTPPEKPLSREPAPEPHSRPEEPSAGRDDAGFDETVAQADVPGARLGSPEAGDGKIRSEAEVFEIMRGFGPFGQSKES